MYISKSLIDSMSWQALERAVSRLLILEGFTDVRIVGQSHDKGADIIAHRFAKRWLFQVKHWKARVGLSVLDRTLEATRTYRADIPVIVCVGGFDEASYDHQRTLLSRGTPLQLWDAEELVRRARKLDKLERAAVSLRKYQETAVSAILRTLQEEYAFRALIVMATGLGKTVVAAEAVGRIRDQRQIRVLVLAHTNTLVYQLEKSFWRHICPNDETYIWNGIETPSREILFTRLGFTFACIDSVYNFMKANGNLPCYDVIVVDECHHAGAEMYRDVVEFVGAGAVGGPFLLGLTATPWRPDGMELDQIFGEPLVSIDIVSGLKQGFLADIDYRLFVDNIKWESLAGLTGKKLSPRQINRTLFISEWDDAVVRELRTTWTTVANPRAVVFCGTIDHAITMRDRINALGFCNAGAIYSGTDAGRRMQAYERSRMLSDFHDGRVNVICVVDIFNEGIDVPDVNIIVFQRVTHSRRIFVQQLGRGLRLADGKSKVIVLDFVSDIRRFAAGLEMKDLLREGTEDAVDGPTRIRLNSTVTFRRAGAEDPTTESFLREWIEDVAAVEGAPDDAAVLRFPPLINGMR